ncbi:MAG: cupin domain-containing protein [Cyanobacteria bacterium J06626_14]
MSTPLISPEATFTQLHDHIEYPQSGVLSKIIVKDTVCQYSLFCMAADTEISEHTSSRNAVVHIIEGTGTLTLKGESIRLEPGTLIFMPAHAPHALAASSNLAFILTLSSAS